MKSSFMTKKLDFGQREEEDRVVYSFPIAIVMNSNKFCGLKHRGFSILKFWRSEV